MKPVWRPSVASVQFSAAATSPARPFHPVNHTTMSKRLLSAVALSLFIWPLGASAQTLAVGKWTGFIIPPGGQTLDVSYDVRVESDTLKIDIVNEQVGHIPFTNLKVTDDGMRFEWEPGVHLFCELFLKVDGGYEGECAPEDGDSGTLVMNRPASNNRP